MIKDNNLPIVPGRGLVVKSAVESRLNFLKENDLSVKHISSSSFELDAIQNNIESYIGSSEIPMGLVGPIQFNDNGKSELVYATVGTLEGALVASMNRGAKAVSLSGGFEAEVQWQKMVRSPLFLFDSLSDATLFKEFVAKEFTAVQKVISQYSNHANLKEIVSLIRGTNVHLKFVYSTGDASGQNMTTTCTWHAMMFIVDQFKQKHHVVPNDFVIEGNGASDKKISQYNIDNGRGIQVTATCFLSEEVINKVLRTTAEKMELFFTPSKALANEENMVGYNINVANAVAAFFVATGQDLASIHESSVGFLKLKREDKGLALQLTLSNLVIGTVGGGTQLPTQMEALDVMGCLGAGKVQRFAKLIAGFALGLEMSTYSAIVSGEFAKAHEKLGRNKPVNWLLKSELGSDFLMKAVKSNDKLGELKSIKIEENDILENGILTNITSRISKKLIGFVPLEAEFKNSGGAKQKLLLKSKALDREIIKGLHLMASSIDTDLADLIKEYEGKLEYKKSHIKELYINEKLSECGFPFIPQFFGKKIISKREVFFFVQEFMDYSKLKIVGSENDPEAWNSADVKTVLKALTELHQIEELKSIASVEEFEACKAIPVYDKMLEIVLNENEGQYDTEMLETVKVGMEKWEQEANSIKIPKTVIHNDFNTRNIMVKNDGMPSIYDWELAVIDFPSRDVVEFLSFILPVGFSKNTLEEYLSFYSKSFGKYNDQEWKKAFIYSLKTFIATRVSFYEVAGVVIKFDFSARVLTVALQMLKFLMEDE